MKARFLMMETSNLLIQKNLIVLQLDTQGRCLKYLTWIKEKREVRYFNLKTLRNEYNFI